MKRDPAQAATILDLLYKALRSPFGIVVATSDVTQLTAKLYAARKGIAELSPLILKPSPLDPTAQLWIVRSDAERPAEAHSEPEDG